MNDMNCKASMTANYHTHTWRCLHAQGAEREYVENAIRGGLKVLGFSDHAPMPYPAGYASHVRMRLDQLEDYVDTVLRLKREYQKDIRIHLGFEAEYYPAYFEALLRALEPYPIEYLLLGQHYLGNEIGYGYNGEPTSDPERLKLYCRQCCEALKTGCFSCFAHPDLLPFTGDARLYEHWMGRLCRCAKEQGIPLEVNLLGIREGRRYPNPAFWEIAQKTGNQVIFGADAHQPDKVCDPASLPKARQFAGGLTVLDTLRLRPPRAGAAGQTENAGRDPQ